MRNYNGGSVAVFDGKEIEISANLAKGTEGHLQTWGGSIDGLTDADQWALMNAQQGVLRMPDGREGNFIVKNAAAFSTQSSTVTSIRITGSGEAPF